MNQRVGPALWLRIYLATFAALVIWHFKSLGDPPYFDEAMGLFSEASYLADSGFDHRGLWHEVSAIDGGPRAYLISIWPTVVAVAMWIAPSPASALVLLHLGNLAVAAALMVMVGALAARSAGTAGGILIALAVASTPLVAAQFELVGMDLPMLVVSMWALSCVVRRRFGLVAVAGLVAFFIKPTGALVTLANLTFLAGLLPLWFVNGGLAPVERRGWLVGVTANALALLLEVVVYALSPNHEHISSQTPGESFLKYLIVVCPDLLVVATIALAAVVVALARRGTADSTASGPAASAGRVIRWLRGVYDRPLIVYAAIFSAGTLVAIVGYLQVYVPRYLIPLFPLLYLTIAETWLAPGRWRTIGLATLGAIVAVNYINANGALYLDIGPMRRNGLYERSGEFRRDLVSNLALAQLLETQYAGVPIVVGHPYTHYFSMPRLGYVKAPLRGYAINAFSRPELRPAAAMFDDRPTKFVLVSVPNAFYQTGAVSMPAAVQEDSSQAAPSAEKSALLKEIYRDDLASPLTATLVDLSALAEQPNAREAWYCDRLWYDATLARTAPGVVLVRATILAAAGRWDLAERLLGRAVDDCPENVELLLTRAWALYKLGDVTAAGSGLERIVAAHPREASAYYQLAIVRERQSRFDEAAALLARAVEVRDSYREAWFQLGVARFRLNDARGAVAAFERAIELDPTNAQARNNLGVAFVRQEKFAEAERQFAEALRLAPGYVEARGNLERLQAMSKRPDGSAAS